jgi:large subunit ribosomal protein L4
MEISVYDISGKPTSKKVKLSDEIFGITPNEHTVYLDVKQYLANQRQGTHKSKEKSEVNYSTKKIVKQKGSGGARHGSIKANIFVGGGRVFGPRPRDYSFKLNKKVKDLARKSVLSSKVADKALTVVEDFTFEAPRTKSYLEMLTAFSLQNKKTLLVLPEVNKNVILSGRNIENTKITTVSSLNTYDLVNNDVVLLSEGSVKKLNELL